MMAQRFAVRDEARRWIGTPYHHRAHVLGAGVDCGKLLLEVYRNAGLIEHFDPGMYAVDWHLHREQDLYLEILERWCTRVDDCDLPLSDRPALHVATGDILMWRVGRTFSHGAIVDEWPFIIHAYLPSNMVERIDIRGTPIAKRPMRVYTYWGTK